jgi:hypothetical protein
MPIDSDNAIVGLMARHLGQGTPRGPYGPLDAWVAAPSWRPWPDDEALRLPVFLGLPSFYRLRRYALHPSAALPAAVLMACPLHFC